MQPRHIQEPLAAALLGSYSRTLALMACPLPAIIRKAMDKYSLDEDAPGDYELVQVFLMITVSQSQGGRGVGGGWGGRR